MKVTNQYIQEIGLIGTAVIGGSAIALYKRFLSDAARKCNQFYGPQKSVCMLNYKIKATQAMLKNSKTNEDQLMWKARLQKYQYQLTIAKKKWQTQQRKK